MLSVIVFSSYVAASRVGGQAVSLALARRGVEPLLFPTTLFGRHPGHGPPGGAAVPAATLAAMAEAAGEQGAFSGAQGVLTGYFAEPGQVAVAADAIDRVKAAHPRATILVDPILGDNAQAYVPPSVARLVARDLLPRAGILTPNLTELCLLTGLAYPHDDALSPEAIAQVVDAARSLPAPALVTSIPLGEKIGVLMVLPFEATLIAHRRLPFVPHGAGDVLAAIMLAELLAGAEPTEAGEAAVRVVGDLASRAVAMDHPDLPIAACPDCIDNPATPVVRIEV
jgi:pyridoxine kinase